ncbi:MAG: hypothetical protein JW726_13905 [Anaerolineales bacterium]|nr:hypothetical protein [Anaerolineales bacterium]
MNNQMDERMAILKMIEESKISAEQGAQLLAALGTAEKKAEAVPPTPPTPPTPAPAPGVKPPQISGRWFRVLVTDTSTGKHKVSVRLPMRLVNWGLKVGSRYTDELEGIDMEELSSALEEGGDGQLIDVIDEEDGEHVQVFIE